MTEYASAVFIGRFQPFHDSHLEIARQGLKIANNLVIVIGSCNAAPTIKNPFSFEERREMILSCFNPEDISRIHVVPVRDYFSSNNAWVTDVQQKTSEFINYGDSVALLGNYKDDSSYYLKMFPQWDFVPSKTMHTLNSTDIRALLFNPEGGDWDRNVPKPVKDWIEKNLLGDGRGTERYTQLFREFTQIKKYKELWKDAPFPPTFVTTDAVVVKSGHVLLVKRKFEPGRGLMALPGGFLKVTERIEDGMLRELREETGLKVAAPLLRASIKESRVFDFPERSLRGRTITHAYYIKLEDGGDLPDVRGNDDAAKAFWLPLMDVSKRENEFFEDHCQIIWHFIGR